MAAGLQSQSSMFHLVKQSANEKTGRIPVSISGRETCPSTCPLKGKGCYANTGPLAIHWNRVTDGRTGVSFGEFLESIKALRPLTFWRHNQAGDLAGLNTTIDQGALSDLIKANRGKRGYTYTHKPVIGHQDARNNRKAIAKANRNGFAINLSANNLEEVDQLKALAIGPVVTVLPLGAPNKQITQAGNVVIKCPAQYKDKVTCATCKLCAIIDRKVVIGFEAHGRAKNKVNELALR